MLQVRCVVQPFLEIRRLHLRHIVLGTESVLLHPDLWAHVELVIDVNRFILLVLMASRCSRPSYIVFNIFAQGRVYRVLVVFSVSRICLFIGADTDTLVVVIDAVVSTVYPRVFLSLDAGARFLILN